MTTKPTNVRLATPTDEDRLFPILMMAHADNGVMPVSEFRVWEIIRNGTRKDRPKEERTGYNVIGIIEGKDKIEGVISLELSRMAYSEHWHLQDICNYVHPDFRRSNHANDLLEFAKWMAEQMKFPLIFGILTAKRLEAKRRFYQRHAKEAGSLYIHNPIYGALAEMA